ncbi:hypothetical protein ACA910_019897 [Epithemia clementina (nom. ined.)]
MFISKKQKQKIRERRKKRRKAGSDKNSCVEDIRDTTKHNVEAGVNLLERNNNCENGESASVESTPSEKSLISEDREKKGPGYLAATVINGKRIVVVKSCLAAKEAKKFRKDARREARKLGINEDDLEFVEEGQQPTSAQEPANIVKQNRKRQREFPKINLLLEEEKQREEKRLKREAQEKDESLLSDEVKDRYRAVDCEMVGIGSKGKISVLARVSVTNWSGSVLLDTFVKVPSKVTDFRTQWSGVSARHLKSETAMDPEQCRSKVAALLKGKILVGHALKNDLDALMLTHPKEDIRDTARYRPFQREVGKKWRPRKLRDLVKEHCDITIQRDGESHDSTDDARAAMELYKVARNAWEAEVDRKSKKKSLR